MACSSGACRPRHGRARETVAASSLFANRRAADARGPVASPRPRHPVAPAPTSVDGNLPPTLGPAPNQRPDPGAGAVPPPTRHPSTGLAHARPCRALRPASSPGAPLARHGASRLRPADRDMTQTRTQYKIHCTGSLVPRRECARTVRSSSKASNPTFQPLIGSQEPTPEMLVPVIKLPNPNTDPQLPVGSRGPIVSWESTWPNLYNRVVISTCC